MVLKSILIASALWFTPISTDTTPTPQPPVVVEECVTPSAIKEQIEAVPTLKLRSHNTFSGIDAQELGNYITTVVGQAPPGEYKIITASVVDNGIQTLTLFMFYNEKGCSYTRTIFTQTQMDVLRSMITNSRIRFE